MAKAFSIGVEVGAVRRQEEQACAGRLDGLSDSQSLMARQIVHHHDVARRELGHENLVHIGVEGVSVDRAIEHQRRDHTGEPEAGDEGSGLPMAMRDAGPEPFALRRTAAQTSHVGRRPRLVDKDEADGVEIELAVKPVFPALQNIRALLLRRVRGLFLNVSPQRSRKVHSVARPARTPRSAPSRSSILLIVMSGVAATRPIM